MPRRPAMICAGCSKPIHRGRTSLPEGQATCLDCRRSRRGERPTACAACSAPFESKPRGGTWTSTCSKACAQHLRLLQAGRPRGRDPEKVRAANQAKNWRRRARLKGVESEPYTTDEIAQRDGFRCGLCRRDVNMSLRRPHPRSSSIDHIVPLSKGGDDTRANVQLAHLDCNIRKGNTVDHAQPLLFG